MEIGEGSVLRGKVITKMEIMTSVVANRINMKRIKRGHDTYLNFKGDGRKIGYIAMPYPDPTLKRNRIYLIVFAVGFNMDAGAFVKEASELIHHFRNAFHFKYSGRMRAGWSTQSMHSIVRVPAVKRKEDKNG